MKQMSEKKVPGLRFPEFGGEWVDVKFRDRTNKIYSGKDKPENEGQYAVYGSTGVIGKSHSFSHRGKYLLIARVGANAGTINYVNGEFGVTDNTLVIETKDSSDLEFTHASLKKYNLHRLLFGSGQPLITGGQLKSIRLFYPTLPEQQKIASFLSAGDRKIQQLFRKKELLEQYKKGVMQKIFSREIRFKPALSEVEGDENGKDYPDWEEKRLGEILTFFPTNSLSRNDLNYDSGRILNIHYGDIHTKFSLGFDVTNENVPFINENIDLSNISEEQYCQKGDIVIADASEDYNDIGKATEIINLSHQKIVAGLHTFLGRDISNQTVVGFKRYLFQTVSLRKQIQNIAQGISVLGISKKNLAQIEFSLPCKDEQMKIVAFLNGLDKKINILHTQITQTQSFKKGLLQRMFV